MLVVQAERPERQRAILRESLRLGLTVSAPVMLAVAALALAFPEHVASGLPGPLVALAAAAGCAAVVPGMLNGYWLGQQRRDLMLALALGSAALQLVAAHGTARFASELRRAAFATLLPSALALGALGALHRPVFSLLYDESFRMSDATVALFFAGTLARIASWLPLYALYAMRRTGPLVVGEFLSMPLFAVLLAAYPRPLSLEAAGALWLAAYLGYGLFNLWAVRRAA